MTFEPPRRLKAGLVPSLEIMPFMAWAPVDRFEVRSCPGYGSVIRRLLTGDLDAGLVPWELLVTDLLFRPGQRGRWHVPAVIKACQMELVLSASAARRIDSTRRRKPGAGPMNLVFGIEAVNSFTKFQIIEWARGRGLAHLAPPAFKILPMNLMVKGMELGEIDGMLAPCPWGMRVEKEGLGRLDQGFDPGELAQQVVLVVRAGVVDGNRPLLAGVAEGLREYGRIFRDPAAFALAAAAMAELGTPRLDPELLWDAAKRCPFEDLPAELVPDAEWFDRELALVAGRHSIALKAATLGSLARRLVLPE